MNCDAGFRGVMLSAGVHACAHRCRYCLVDERERREILPFENFAQLAEKYVGWSEATPRASKVFVNMRYSYECSLERIRWFLSLRARCGSPVDSLLLGGLARRHGDAARDWVVARKEVGIGTVIASFAGAGATHDFWNGRSGDCEHLLEMLRQADSAGLAREERIFFNKKTLGEMDTLLGLLDALPGEYARRRLFLFMYRGKAAHLEAERIDAYDRDALADKLRAFVDDITRWRTEAEWMDWLAQEDEAPRPRLLHLGITWQNVRYLNETSCEEVVANLRERAETAYAVIPPLGELGRQVGDRKSLLIYSSLDDVGRLWIDRWQERTGIVFERALTDFSTW